jgi:glycerol kinase
MSYILALDQGTTSSRAIVFDRNATPRAMAQHEIHQIYPQPGWVEHDPLEIWSTQLAAAREAIAHAGIESRDIAAIGITNQRETAVLWDRATGQPICNAIVWQDRRTAGFCDALRDAGHENRIQHKTGLVIDAYFSASKLRWMLDHIPGARQRAERGELAFGTVDAWLLWNLTDGAVHATDVTNASRTMLMDLHTRQWDQGLLDLFDIPILLLPQITPSSGMLGTTDLLGERIPIAGVAGDQQAALFGQNCFSRGMAKNTFGTGCFMLMNTGLTPVASTHKLLTTLAWQLQPGQASAPQFAMEGSVFVGGAVVQWLRDGLGIVRSAADVEALAASVPDSGDVYMVPAFAGLGAPHWDQYARGTIAGITRGTSAAHLARAALESIAFQVADVLDVMQSDAQIPITQLRVDGGAAANNLLMQFQADLLRVPVIRPRVLETTALGAAYLAGLAVGFWNSTDELASHLRVDRAFEPVMSADEAHYRRGRWNAALSRARDWDREAANRTSSV